MKASLKEENQTQRCSHKGYRPADHQPFAGTSSWKALAPPRPPDPSVTPTYPATLIVFGPDSCPGSTPAPRELCTVPLPPCPPHALRAGGQPATPPGHLRQGVLCWGSHKGSHKGGPALGVPQRAPAKGVWQPPSPGGAFRGVRVRGVQLPELRRAALGRPAQGGRSGSHHPGDLTLRGFRAKEL